jgi:hypothetical protein
MPCQSTWSPVLARKELHIPGVTLGPPGTFAFGAFAFGFIFGFAFAFTLGFGLALALALGFVFAFVFFLAFPFAMLVLLSGIVETSALCWITVFQQPAGDPSRRRAPGNYGCDDFSNCW